MLDLRGTKNILSLLWNDKMTISKAERISDELGDNITYKEQYADIPCRLSFSGRDNPHEATNTDFEVQKATAVVFCDPEIQVAAGDFIKVIRQHGDGTTYSKFSGLVIRSGRANKYDNHQEFLIELLGDA